MHEIQFDAKNLLKTIKIKIELLLLPSNLPGEKSIKKSIPSIFDKLVSPIYEKINWKSN